MLFTDIHSHILYGVDDGAKNGKQMSEMLASAYLDGIRILCVTPHFSHEYFRYDREKVIRAFVELKKYAAAAYPDMRLFLGNELRYSQNSPEMIRNRECLTLNGSHYVLVDFDENEDESRITNALYRILSYGYKPILAHAERYRHYPVSKLEALRSDGVVIQIDSMSVFGNWGFSSKLRSRKILKEYLADVVASDAHNTESRPPLLSKCYDYVLEKCGSSYAKSLFSTNPRKILADQDL